MEHILNETLMALRELADADAVIGGTIHAPDRTMVVPVSRVSVGLVSGSGDYAVGKRSLPQTAGLGGAGGSVQPVGFLVLAPEGVRFLSVDGEEKGDKWQALMRSAFDLVRDKLK
ncbi:MAG: hypothetical protein IJX70_01260 [Clostridia bacterium]|nr:hypothetical protein [Clostridia bacterium]